MAVKAVKAVAVWVAVEDQTARAAVRAEVRAAAMRIAVADQTARVETKEAEEAQGFVTVLTNTVVVDEALSKSHHRR